MSPLPFRRLFSFGTIRRDAAGEVEAELAFHFDRTIEQLVAAGYTEEDAREEAQRRFGDYAQYRAALERTTRGRVRIASLAERWHGLVKDVRYAARGLVHARGFTGIVVFTLAVGIGAGSLMFSLVNGVVLDALPFPDADRLVRVYDTNPERGSEASSSSPANFVDWREQQGVFTGLAAFTNGRAAYTDARPAETAVTANVSAGWFAVVGVPPMLGRGFTRDEEVYGNHHVTVVSHAFWLRYLDADSAALGRTVSLDGTPHTLVGVMPPGFAYPTPDVQLWQPLAFDFDVSEARGVHYLNVIARLAPGVSLEQASAHMDVIMGRMTEVHPERLTGWGVRLVNLQDSIVGSARQRLLILFGAVGLVLLTAGVNVANLMLARATSRGRELAVRVALGAGRWRVTRQLVIEGVMLAAAAGAVGLLLASLTLRTVSTFARGIPRLENVSIGGPVLFVTAGAAVLVGACLGLVAAWSGSRSDLSRALKDGGREGGGGDGPQHHRIRGGFVVTQVALAVMLVVGAGLLLRSFAALTNVDPGYERRQAWTATLSVPSSRYPDDRARAAFFLALTDSLQGIAGVDVAAAATQLPLEGYSINFSFMVDGQDLPISERPNGDFRVVTPRYFAAMEIPVLRGRVFDDTDTPESAPVIVVNETLARQQFGDADPIRRRLRISYGDEAGPREIIGVVGDVRQRTLAVPPQPGYYLPIQQVPWSTMRVVAASTVAPGTLTDPIRAMVARLDPLLAVRDVRTLDQRFAAVVGSPRFNTLVLGLFAAIAIVVAVSGIYSVMSYVVSQRTREIGVKMALGAGESDVRRAIAWGGLRLAGIGALLGLAGALGGGRILASMLFGVRPSDPMTLLLAPAAFIAVAWLASYVPARRASRVDPVIALRAE